MSMLGLSVGWTSPIVIVPVVRNRVRMSLRLEATTNCEIGVPMRWAP